LVEAGLRKIVDKLIVVKVNRNEQIRRIQNKNSLSKQDILKRIKSQIPLRVKTRLADFVIDNSGSIQKTKKQVGQIRRLLWRN
jgi:dephospho-CoA kinase